MKSNPVLVLTLIVVGVRDPMEGGRSVDSPCEFSLTTKAVTPRISGPQEIVRRASIMKQPDSPVEIVEMDFTDSVLSVMDERFEWDKAYDVRLHNRSSREVVHVKVNATVGTMNGVACGGTGWEMKLAPGETAFLEPPTRQRSCSGSARKNEVYIVAWVESVLMVGCEYMPSKTWPFPWDKVR